MNLVFLFYHSLSHPFGEPSYFDSDKVTVDASELPFVRQTKQEQLNFTLWPSTTENWSDEIDFGIQLNRRPAYFAQSSVTSAIRSVVFGDFARLIRLGPDGPAASVLGVELTIVSHRLNRDPVRAEVNEGSVVHPLPGRTRIVLLGGFHVHDLVSTEMLIRMVRHYVVGTLALFVICLRRFYVTREWF